MLSLTLTQNQCPPCAIDSERDTGPRTKLKNQPQAEMPMHFWSIMVTVGRWRARGNLSPGGAGKASGRLSKMSCSQMVRLSVMIDMRGYNCELISLLASRGGPTIPIILLVLLRRSRKRPRICLNGSRTIQLNLQLLSPLLPLLSFLCHLHTSWFLLPLLPFYVPTNQLRVFTPRVFYPQAASSLLVTEHNFF